MRILVCGSRDFSDYWRVHAALTYYLSDNLEIISGMATGADYLGVLYSYNFDLKLHKYPANWRKYGKSAGPIRNQQMIDEGKPDLILAFPGGNGTADMTRRGKKHNIKIIEYK